MEQHKTNAISEEAKALITRIDSLPGEQIPGEMVPAREIPDGEEEQAVEKMRRILPKMVDRMEEMLDSPRVPAQSKIRIMEIVLERTLGKVETAVKLSGNVQTMEEARAKIEAIFAAVRVERGIK